MITVTNMAEEFAGLAADTKPTVGVSNGSKFIEMDTGLTYYFDAENETWEQFPPAADSQTEQTK